MTRSGVGSRHFVMGKPPEVCRMARRPSGWPPTSAGSPADASHCGHKTDIGKRLCAARLREWNA